MAITKNIVTDYACPTNGTSNCRPAFLAFKADAAGQTATLTVPVGTYTFDAESIFPDDVYIFDGIPNLTVNAAGATFARGSGGTAGFWLGGRGVTTTFAKVDSVYPGARQVRCKTASDANNFPVGRYICLMSLDMQGLWTTSYGFPPNNHFFEWLKIASANGTTGIVAFTDPVTQTHKDYWPEYGQGALPTQGGPATMLLMSASWDCVHVYNGGIYEAGTGAAINCAGRDITFNNHVQSGLGINPSANQVMRFIDSTLGFTEVDKLIGTLYFGGATTATQTQFQSSSVDLFHISGTTNVGTLNGTPKKVKADPGTTIGTLALGPTYGRTDEVYFDGCTINTISNGVPGGTAHKGPGNVGINVAYSMTSGIITIPNSDNAVPWAIPGTYVYWTNDSFSTETGFRVLDVTQDATNIYVKTDMAGGFPSVPLSSGKLYLRVHPAPKATFVNCTGCAEVVDWSQFGTIPFASRSRRTFTKTQGTSNTNYYVPGKVQSIKYIVNTAFAGTQNPLTFKGGGQFSNLKTLGPPTSYTPADYGPVIDLRAAPHTVTIAPSGVTGSAGGDASLALPDPNTWFTGTVGVAVSNDVSADPSNFSITVEIIMDQGIVEDQRSARVRFRPK